MLLNNTQIAVHPNARIGKNVNIFPFSYIDEDVVIGDNCEIGPNAIILNGARLGNNCKVFPGAVISAIPQDLKYDNEYTTVEIGDNTTIREYVTINRGTNAYKKTTVGKNCLIMAYCHIAHDCVIGNNCVLVNCVNLAGHVQIGDWVVLEGLVAVNQFIHIGDHAFVAGGSLVRKNVPPYVKAAREPLAFAGVNVVGLRRRDFSEERIQLIEEIYRILFIKSQNISNGLREIETQIPDSEEKQLILRFISNSDKGIMRGFHSINNGSVHVA
ncbi:MAG: acyl-ACP--UDP-N-acetylglucosamine O-acyltransferase [Chitinophagales bacterium]|nr:acyl-ACP--UDP-N-acetylglucosamine O-acyltransferase [Bacteroidota bacterium]MCB9042158.1 acyl-ACP--UDP-N-acetylglucosamine O-acyltransferase [Chitinophagales bacterium]